MTGLAFYRGAEDRLLTGYDLTYVTFRELTDEMIEGYLDQGTFLDKAGAYAVQEVGDAFVARMKGDYDNVVGFPVEKVRRMLARFMTGLHGPRSKTSTSREATAKPRQTAGKLWCGAVPGETVRVQVVGERGPPHRRGHPRRIPSPRRAEPRCAISGCGGCRFQHLDYAAQLELKARHLIGPSKGRGSPARRP